MFGIKFFVYQRRDTSINQQDYYDFNVDDRRNRNTFFPRKKKKITIIYEDHDGMSFNMPFDINDTMLV